MIRRLLNGLTSRRVSIALMIFVAVTGAIGAWVPQRVNTPEATFETWAAASPTTAAIYSALGLDRIFTTWWYSAVLAVFLLSVSIATWRMFATAWRRTHSQPPLPRNPVPAGDLDAITARARAAGYREYSSAGGVRVFWRHRSGLWAPGIMHAGMVVAILAAVAAAAFTTRGVIDFSMGEIFSPGDEFLAVEGGAFSTAPELGTPMRLDELTTQEWPSGELKTVTAHLSLMDEARGWVAHESNPTYPLRFEGHTIYVQPGEFGEAAFLMTTAADGAAVGLRAEFPFVARGTAGYSDLRLPDGTPIEARWDPYGVRGDELLALRLAGDETATPVTLSKGEVAALAGYDIEFVEQGQWARLIVVRPVAINVLFLGFAIIGAGSLMMYVWIPRQLVLAQGPGGEVRYSWRMSRMAQAYESERFAILGQGQEGDV